MAERLFEFTDLGAVMRGGWSSPAMLINGWLAEGHLHWFQGEPEDGKTWILLWLIAQVLNDGGRCLFADEEMGPEDVARRLLALGVDPDVVVERLDYLPFPGLQFSDKKEWAALASERQWDFAVLDSSTDFLAAAQVEENDGVGFTRWVKTFVDPIRINGGTVAVADHVVKAGAAESRGYAVGTRAKRAKAKVVWEVNVSKKFGPDNIGKVEFLRRKNTVGAALPPRHILHMGSDDGGETFVVEPTSTQTVDLSEALAPGARRIREFLQGRNGEPATRAEIEDGAGVSPSTFRRHITCVIDAGEVEPLGDAQKKEALRYRWIG